MDAQRWTILRRWYVVVALAWFVRYATLGHLPQVQQPIWHDWFDQGRYLASTAAFAKGSLAASAHWYPFAYPLLAAPFAWILPGDPFFLLDLLLFLTTCAGFRRVAVRLALGPWTATSCFLVTALVQTDLAATWAHPWTTTLSAALIWWLIDRTLRVGEEIDGVTLRRTLFVIGALAMALPLARPVDVLIGATCLAIVAATLVQRHLLSLQAVAAVATGGMIVVGVYGALHLTIYGPHPTAYMAASARIGFVWADLGWKAYVLLVNPLPWFPDSTAILQRLPWIVPGLASLIVAAIRGERRQRNVSLLLLALIVPLSTIMLTYADLQPPGLWRFGNIHYFKWAMPAFGAGVILCWRQVRVRADRRVLTIVLAGLVLPLTVRVVPVAVSDDIPARMLLFRGDPDRDWHDGYFASATIIDDYGRMANIRDFHQVPDASGQRAIAISRAFGSNPRRLDPGEPRIDGSQPPYGRFAERITFLGF